MFIGFLCIARFLGIVVGLRGGLWWCCVCRSSWCVVCVFWLLLGCFLGC